MGKLDGKVAIITGAGMGMGKEEAVLFAKEGAKVVIDDIDAALAKKVAEEIKGLGGEALAIASDVSKPGDVNNMVNTTVNTFGKIDIIVNNAAVFLTELEPGSDKYYEVIEAGWDKTMAINLKGVWLCCKGVIPHMLRQKKGKIVNIASADGIIGLKQPIDYIASKHGVVGITRALASGLASEGINVNAICPGEVDTPMIRTVIENFGPLDTLEPAWNVKSLISPPIPMEAVAKLALFLASEDSNYIHGRAIHIGAWMALIP